jgi:hypothetical protein
MKAIYASTTIYCSIVIIQISTKLNGVEEEMSKKMAIPWELKYNFVKGQLTTFFKNILYAYREKFGAEAALEFFEHAAWRRADRVKNVTKTIKEVFKIEGNDAETLAKWREIYWELIGTDFAWLERTKTMCRAKITKCAWQTEPKDISDWALIYNTIIAKNINPKATVERPKAMCAGDPYCEYVYKIEE